jgi:hypothetical protein
MRIHRSPNTLDAKDFNSKILLSSSLWREFFFKYSNDKIEGDILTEPFDRSEYTHYIERPVFVLPMLTFHIGHVLIDLMEEVRK